MELKSDRPPTRTGTGTDTGIDTDTDTDTGTETDTDKHLINRRQRLVSLHRLRRGKPLHKVLDTASQSSSCVLACAHVCSCLRCLRIMQTPCAPCTLSSFHPTIALPSSLCDSVFDTAYTHASRAHKRGFWHLISVLLPAAALNIFWHSDSIAVSDPHGAMARGGKTALHARRQLHRSRLRDQAHLFTNMR
jgi:hypothetical protein